MEKDPQNGQQIKFKVLRPHATATTQPQHSNKMLQQHYAESERLKTPTISMLNLADSLIAQLPR